MNNDPTASAPQTIDHGDGHVEELAVLGTVDNRAGLPLRVETSRMDGKTWVHLRDAEWDAHGVDVAMPRAQARRRLALLATACA